MKEILLIVGSGCDLVQRAVDILDHPGMTAPLDLSPPPVVFIKREEPTIPDIDLKILRRLKTRDWEQRNRKRRR